MFFIFYLFKTTQESVCQHLIFVLIRLSVFLLAPSTRYTPNVCYELVFAIGLRKVLIIPTVFINTVRIKAPFDELCNHQALYIWKE